MRTLSISQARRVALGAQGFNDPIPKGPVTIRGFRRALDRMTILQLDSVNVVCRSHFLPMFARLGSYDRDKLDEWLWRSGENHEYLSHEASITRVELQPLLRERMKLRRWKMGDKLEREEPDYVKGVLDQVDREGPISVSDLDDSGGRTGPWWGLSKGKVCLDVNYVRGVLAIHHRTKTFLTKYDRIDRVLPPEILDLPDPEVSEANKQMLLLGAKSLGVGTDRDIADYFRLKMPVARPLVAELVEDGLLTPVRVQGWDEPAYLHPEASVPRSIEARALLSPFDPVVWFRPRAERLFDFTYRIEIYVPEPKRIYGYYVLPFLLGEELVGRVDVKADRKAGRLLARGVFGEQGIDESVVAPALAKTLEELAQWLGLDAVEIGARGNLATSVAECS